MTCDALLTTCVTIYLNLKVSLMRCPIVILRSYYAIVDCYLYHARVYREGLPQSINRAHEEHAQCSLDKSGWGGEHL